MSAMTRDSGDRRASRAHPPPPIPLLLKTKAQPQFDRTVTDRSKPVFGFILTLNHVAPRLRSGQPLVARCKLLFPDEHPANPVLRIAQSNANVKRIISESLTTPWVPHPLRPTCPSYLTQLAVAAKGGFTKSPTLIFKVI